MKQVIQNFKTGELYVDEVPRPSISKGMVLVSNKYSLISAGTERGTVKVGKASLIGKAKQRPDLVAQVLQNVKKEGFKATLEKVRTKLDALKALGYSTAGVVTASMDTQGVFKKGDRVACAGADYASHADMVGMPQNLMAKIPDNVSFEEASFTTLGAIALQGVRQAEPRLGDKVCVIGLGLLGQITVQLLKANGCSVFGIDLASNLVALSKESGAKEALPRSDNNLLAAIDNFTNGHGFDSVIITAAAPSNDPIELSALISRKKGKVIVVGAVKMDIPRDPDFYRKELELKMSCSYGPGRYDTIYEEEGHDYPYAYVRYTEQRNMETFLQLLSSGALSMKHLITHTFAIEEAEKAYDIVLGKVDEPHIGILLKYSENSDQEKRSIYIKNTAAAPMNVGLIGAGSFAQNYLIPNIKGAGGSLDTAVTTKGITAKNVASKFGFNVATTSANEVLENEQIDTVFIATPHNSHADYTVRALQAGKHVFVEKPLALTYDELEKVKEAYEISNQKLMVGYNRRFAPVSVSLNDTFKTASEPKVILIRINGGFIPKDSWIQSDKIGGGRILGEMCHFIDLMQFLTNARPKTVYAASIATENSKITAADNVSITINFDDESVGNLIYTANGDPSLPKERVEISSGGMVGIIDNFRKGVLHKGNKAQKIKLDGKGHKEEVYAFAKAVKENLPSPIPFTSLYDTTLTTLKILDSLTTGLPQTID